MIAMVTSPLAAQIETSPMPFASGTYPILQSAFFNSPVERLRFDERLVVPALFRYELCGGAAGGKRSTPPDKQPAPKTESDRVREGLPNYPNADKIRTYWDR